MTDSEIERRIVAYKPRKAKFASAFFNGATRTGNMRASGERCEMCDRKEHGGGLSVFRLRDGDEMLAGGRCGVYVDYLIAHPTRARAMLR
jgi:hypothetical protein